MAASDRVGGAKSMDAETRWWTIAAFVVAVASLVIGYLQWDLARRPPGQYVRLDPDQLDELRGSRDLPRPPQPTGPEPPRQSRRRQIQQTVAALAIVSVALLVWDRLRPLKSNSPDAEAPNSQGAPLRSASRTQAGATAPVIPLANQRSDQSRNNLDNEAVVVSVPPTPREASDPSLSAAPARPTIGIQSRAAPANASTLTLELTEALPMQRGDDDVAVDAEVFPIRLGSDGRGLLTLRLRNSDARNVTPFLISDRGASTLLGWKVISGEGASCAAARSLNAFQVLEAGNSRSFQEAIRLRAFDVHALAFREDVMLTVPITCSSPPRPGESVQVEAHFNFFLPGYYNTPAARLETAARSETYKARSVAVRVAGG